MLRFPLLDHAERPMPDGGGSLESRGDGKNYRRVPVLFSSTTRVAEVSACFLPLLSRLHRSRRLRGDTRCINVRNIGTAPPPPGVRGAEDVLLICGCDAERPAGLRPAFVSCRPHRISSPLQRS